MTNDTARYEGNPALCQVAAYDVNAADWAETTERAWQEVARRPWMAGGFVWCGYDYRGEPNPFAWPDINSQYADPAPASPRMSFYYYKSWWGHQPALHIFSALELARKGRARNLMFGATATASSLNCG